MYCLSRFIFIVSIVFAVSSTVLAEDVTLESVPPVVVKTIPAAGATKVKSGLREIKVTFSKEMKDKSWSWVKKSPKSFPEIVGEPKFLKDNKTAVLPVKLESGKTYALSINSLGKRNFKDKNGNPAVIYLLAFETR